MSLVGLTRVPVKSIGDPKHHRRPARVTLCLSSVFTLACTVTSSDPVNINAINKTV